MPVPVDPRAPLSALRAIACGGVTSTLALDLTTFRNVATAHHNHTTMASKASKKLVVCGGNGFLGMFALKRALEVTTELKRFLRLEDS
jgi:hypothetical protein